MELAEYGRVGITLSQDEIAGDGRLCYLDDTEAALRPLAMSQM
jgi:hypothetical protein